MSVDTAVEATTVTAHDELTRPMHLTKSPVWVRWAMTVLVLSSAALYGWDASRAGYSDYYATAARSMSLSWKAFFFGAFDPQSSITLDKLSGFLIPQALSARMFGFSPWSLALPQVVEGLVTILVTYVIIRRWIGPIGGLIGATLMATTPMLVAMFSHPMEDGLLTMFSALAIWALQRALDTDRRRWLVLAGTFVGLGFQAKMMQAWLLLPAMALVYLLVAAGPLGRKLWRLLATAAVTLAVSFSWMTAIALVPSTQRPYIDGTTDNNIFSMVLSYNGVNRFISNFLPGALTNDPIQRASNDAYAVGLVSDGGLSHSPLKFFVPAYASQIGWLYPLAALGILLGAFVIRRATADPAVDRRLRGALVLNVSLLVTLVGVLSVMNFPHTAYVASLALPLASLSAIGIVLAWRDPGIRRSRLRFALPITVAVHTVWSLILMAHYPQFAGALMVVVGVLGAAVSAFLFAHALGWGRTKRIRSTLAAAVVGVVLIGPLAWSLSTIDIAFAGTSNDAYAGPPASALTKLIAQSKGTYGIGLDSNRVDPITARAESRIFKYALAHSGNQQFVLATDSWRSAAPLIMAGDTRVLPMGGYTSRVPAPTAAALEQKIAANSLKFVLLTAPESKSGISTPNVFEIHRWVTANCRLIPEAAYNPNSTPSRTTSTPIDRLYDCSP